LVGELFTRNRLTNNKVMAWLRLYETHRRSSGYLYLKDGDEARFVSNSDIIHRPYIRKISLLREGGEWSENLGVFPDDRIELRIEGESLRRTEFSFGGLEAISDSTMHTDNLRVYRMRIPANYAKRTIPIYQSEQATTYSLQVREHQRPRSLDFVKIDLGDRQITATDFKGQFLYDKPIRDILIAFDRQKIDSFPVFFGKQYLQIDLRIIDKNNALIEMRSLDNVVVCPSENSLRGRFYDNTDCTLGTISLNSLIGRRMLDLDEWTRIELIIKHKNDHYGGRGESQKIEIVLQKHSKFDIDLSFPGGLILKKFNEQEFSTLGGISMAVLAQFKFYQNGKINKLKPFQVGIGTLAFNVFNFSENNANRDLGIVVLGSVFPTRKDVRMTLPLYAGFGYLIKDGSWFFVLGPGLRINL
jgi:hypothetical protein